MRGANLVGKVGLVLITTAVTAVCAEVAFRALLFSDSPLAGRFQRPELYADYYSDDLYWFLHYRFNDVEDTRSAVSHPVLGWVNDFDPTSYEHQDYARVGNRRPILLYGDSFAECVTPQCYEDYFNHDPLVDERCFLLNYGVGAYGIDQTYLLFSKSVDEYRNPFVIFSLLTEDIDRAAHRVFVAQKPLFHVKEGQLVLDPEPIAPNPRLYFEEHRPAVTSYLYRLFTHHPRLPNALSDFLLDEKEKRATKAELARLILGRSIADLRHRELDFFFLVFSGPFEFDLSPEADWRARVIRETLEAEGVPYVMSRDIVRDDMKRSGRPVESYFIPGDNHPNEYQNQIIADALERRLGFCQVQ